MNVFILKKIVIGVCVVFSMGMVTGNASTSAMSSGSNHPSGVIQVHQSELVWQEGPASLPAGAKFAVIEGDPSKPGLFTMRLALPASYTIPPHFHPTDEHVTIISGAINLGSGGMLDKSKENLFTAGDFFMLPTGHPHYVWTTEATVLQLHGMGPWGITYVNPTDDPRR